MPEIIDAKITCPKHRAPIKISEVIASLINMKDTYGDLPVELCAHITNTDVMEYQDIFYAYNTYDDGTKNISIQSFPY